MGKKLKKKLLWILIAVFCIVATVVAWIVPILPASPFIVMLVICVVKIMGKRISDFIVIDSGIREFVWQLGEEILVSDSFLKEKEVSYHKNISVYDHSLQVACCSVFLCRKVHKDWDYSSLVRGALLHDFYFDDEEETKQAKRKNRIKHAQDALENAASEFSLNEIEQDVICHHMFPLQLSPPKTKEGGVVCVADKIVTLQIFIENHYDREPAVLEKKIE